MAARSDPAPLTGRESPFRGIRQLPACSQPEEIEALRADVRRVFDEYPPDNRGDPPEQSTPFRYEMINRSSVVQQAIGHPRILEVVEFLLGEDCHVIANTAWWQQPGDNRHLGRFWHIDAGPHVPARWAFLGSTNPLSRVCDRRAFVSADCPINAGPTGVIPGSHTSGQAPPWERAADDDLEWEGRGTVPIVAEAGDVALFVSDLWHRRLPLGPADPGRMFVQCHYGRRDIAQRLRPTSVANHLSVEAMERARTPREKTLVGIHPLSFYDG